MSDWYHRRHRSHGISISPIQKRLLALWPQVPLAIAISLVGLLNLLDGLRVPLTLLPNIRTLNGLAESLSVLGGTTQAILGLMLVVAGVGLLRRLSFAWTLAVLLLVIALGVNAAQRHWSVAWLPEAVMLGLLILTRRQFTRRTVMASLLLSLSSIFAIMAYGVFGSFLLGSGFRPQIQDLNTAAYFTIVTLSTVGYGDIVPVTAETRWFVISLLVVGLGVFASAIASALGPRISEELTRLFNPRTTAMTPKDHVILVGEGSIAQNMAKELKQRGVSVVRIVATKSDADASDPLVIEGDATNDEVLRQAGIEQARLVIAARDDDRAPPPKSSARRCASKLNSPPSAGSIAGRDRGACFADRVARRCRGPRYRYPAACLV
ncbi:MAG TPA: ion channel [Tepidisphaeraceae bacterium]|jgi:voltage-gated potassium channel|nr:ion channel [Tepidisphaeraceae bacterium]